MRKIIPVILIITILLGTFAIPRQEVLAQSGVAQTVDQSSYLESTLKGCGIRGGDNTALGCFVQIGYVLFVTIPSFILSIAAHFFNYMTLLTLSSDMYDKDFIGKIWRIVRDFANIFFILILLYAALQLILNLGHDAKKIVVGVIVVALLVNFSLFFTRVVIDASNVVGLIFYNRIKTDNVPNKPISQRGEKDISGALVSRFNINNFFTSTTVQQATGGQKKMDERVSLAMMTIYAVVIFPLAYAFIVVGLAFLGRMVMLMILMMMAPLAFVTGAVPSWREVKTIGFKDWLHKLLQTSFMAAVFMFILYIVSEILAANIFSDVASNQGIAALLIGLFVPAVVIIMLLLKGAKYAQEASGDLAGKIAGGVGKMAMGFVGGTLLGAAAVAGRATVGRAGHAAANSQWARRWERSGFGGEFVMDRLKKVGGASFDVRATKAGATLGSATGLNLGKAQEGGFTQRRAKDVERRTKRGAEVEVGEDEKLKQELNKSERDLQELMDQVVEDFRKIDKDLVSARQKKADATSGSSEEEEAIAEIRMLRARKDAIKDGSMGPKVASGVNAGKSIKEMEEDVIPDAKHDIHAENVRRRGLYAKKVESGWNRGLNFVLSGGQYSFRRGANEAAHRIRMGKKLDSGEKH
jgi:hypothetical protein